MRGDAGFELADRAGGGVARVGEYCQSLLLALVVHFLKAAMGISISPRTSKVGGNPGFLQLVQRNGKRDGAHRAHIQGDVFADGAVAARDAADQLAILVVQGQRHAVELQFANVVDVVAAAQFVDAAFPVAQFVLAVGVVERQHGRGVRRFEESFARLAADALGGRIGSDQFGMFGFELLQLDHELVELGVCDFGGVEDVVEIFVVADFFPQCFDLVFGPLVRWHD